MEKMEGERKARKDRVERDTHIKGRYWWGKGLGSWEEGTDGWRRGEGTPGRKGCSAQHLVPKLMRGGSWPASQEGIHLHKIPHLHGIPGNLHTDGSLCLLSLTPPPLAEGLGEGAAGVGVMNHHDLGSRK